MTAFLACRLGAERVAGHHRVVACVSSAAALGRAVRTPEAPVALAVGDRLQGDRNGSEQIRDRQGEPLRGSLGLVAASAQEGERAIRDVPRALNVNLAEGPVCDASGWAHIS
jgi:hypothetical protein